MFTLKGQWGLFPPPRDADIAAFKLGRQDSLVTLWWASFYGHAVVQNLLFEGGIFDSSASLFSAIKAPNKAVVQASGRYRHGKRQFKE